jgi:hypothetical protein
MIERPRVSDETYGLLILAAAILAAILSITGLGFGLYDRTQLIKFSRQANVQLRRAEREKTHQLALLEQEQSQADIIHARQKRDVEVLTTRLRITQSQLKEARAEAAQVLDQDAQTLTYIVSDFKNQVATKANGDELNTTISNINSAKIDLEGTSKEVNAARGELHTLVGRNHDEINLLRRRGERDYVEFTIEGRNKPHRIGNIMVELRSVDTRKNQFTVVLVVDDLRTEDKDHALNQPIVFFLQGTHDADEFIVNTLDRDKIGGYISMPKSTVNITTATASSTLQITSPR